MFSSSYLVKKKKKKQETTQKQLNSEAPWLCHGLHRFVTLQAGSVKQETRHSLACVSSAAPSAPYKQNTVSKYISLTYSRRNYKQNKGWAILTMYVRIDYVNIYEIHHEYGRSLRAFGVHNGSAFKRDFTHQLKCQI